MYLYKYGTNMVIFKAHNNLGSGSSANCENWHILLPLKCQQRLVPIYETLWTEG